jgi:hypothetical protein
MDFHHEHKTGGPGPCRSRKNSLYYQQKTININTHMLMLGREELRISVLVIYRRLDLASWDAAHAHTVNTINSSLALCDLLLLVCLSTNKYSSKYEGSPISSFLWFLSLVCKGSRIDTTGT